MLIIKLREGNTGEATTSVVVFFHQSYTFDNTVPTFHFKCFCTIGSQKPPEIGMCKHGLRDLGLQRTGQTLPITFEAKLNKPQPSNIFMHLVLHKATRSSTFTTRGDCQKNECQPGPLMTM